MKRRLKLGLVSFVATASVVGGGFALGGSAGASTLQPQNCYGNPFCIINCALNPSACPPPFTCSYVWCTAPVGVL
jgi:hypothetical protein